MHAGLHHAVDEGLQLLLCEGHVESLPHLAHCRRTVPETWETGTCGNSEKKRVPEPTVLNAIAIVHK